MRMFALGLGFAVAAAGCAENSTDLASYFAAKKRQDAAEEARQQRAQQDRQADAASELAAYGQRQKEDEARRETWDAAARANSDNRKAKEQAIVDWLKASPAQCAARLNHSSCRSGSADAKAGSLHKCETECQEAIQKALLQTATDAFAACISSDGPVTATCKLDLPDGADPDDKGIAEFSPKLETARLACSDLCSKQRAENAATAGDRKRASEQGAALVLAYKRCMVATDSTVQAIRYRAYDRDLYDNLMQTTNERCRANSKCDWLEKYSQDFACEYSGR